MMPSSSATHALHEPQCSAARPASRRAGRTATRYARGVRATTSARRGPLVEPLDDARAQRVGPVDADHRLEVGERASSPDDERALPVARTGVHDEAREACRRRRTPGPLRGPELDDQGRARARRASSIGRPAVEPLAGDEGHRALRDRPPRRRDLAGGRRARSPSHAVRPVEHRHRPVGAHARRAGGAPRRPGARRRVARRRPPRRPPRPPHPPRPPQSPRPPRPRRPRSRPSRSPLSDVTSGRCTTTSATSATTPQLTATSAPLNVGQCGSVRKSTTPPLPRRTTRSSSFETPPPSRSPKTTPRARSRTAARTRTRARRARREHERHDGVTREQRERDPELRPTSMPERAEEVVRALATW